MLNMMSRCFLIFVSLLISCALEAQDDAFYNKVKELVKPFSNTQKLEERVSAMEVTTHHLDTKKKNRKLFEYGEGKLMKLTEFQNDDITSERFYEYHADGTLKSQKTINKKMKDTHIEFEYADGKRIKETDLLYNKTTEIKYLDDHTEIKCVSDGSSDTLRYDNSRNLIYNAKCYSLSEGDQLVDRTSNLYNEKNELTQIKRYSATVSKDGTVRMPNHSTFENTYNDNGWLIQQTFYTFSNDKYQLISDKKVSYEISKDALGRYVVISITEEQRNKRTHTIKYTLDDHYNWIELVESENGKLSRSTKRKINYVK